MAEGRKNTPTYEEELQDVLLEARKVIVRLSNELVGRPDHNIELAATAEFMRRQIVEVLSRARASTEGGGEETMPCTYCNGTGAVDTPTSADDPACPECDGEGKVSA